MYLGSRDMCRLRELEQHLMELDLDLNRTEHTREKRYNKKNLLNWAE